VTLADRVVVALSQPFLVAERLVSLGASVGVAHARDLADEADPRVPPWLRPFGGDVLVDGGVLDVLPVRQAAAWGAERIIAVDVGSEMTPPAEKYFERGMVAIHERVLTLNLQEQRKRCLDGWQGPPVVYIRPRIGHLGGWDFGRTQYFLEEGYRAAREALKAADAA